MLRPITRIPIRSASRNLPTTGQRHQRRNIGFAGPALKRRTWKGSLARWGLAAGGIYWYMNSDFDLFNKEANELGYVGTEIIDDFQEPHVPTLDAIAASRRDRQRATLSSASAPSSASTSIQFNSSASTDPSSQVALKQDASLSTAASGSLPADAATPASPGALEEEAQGEGAFNEETGEINWDCPCLGGMAHGPCGEDFREAFSCFVFSKDEPKGVDCIDRFKSMQDCFRQHPDIYGAELTDDVDENEDSIDTSATPELVDAAAPAPYSGANVPNDALPPNNLTASPSANPISTSSATKATTQSSTGGEAGTSATKVATPANSDPTEVQKGRTERAKAASNQVRRDFGDGGSSEDERNAAEEKGKGEIEELIPKAAHDTTYMNAQVVEAEK